VTDKGTEAAVAAATGDLTANCAHCGFCLSSCPTYVLGGNEAQSPHGRIQLASMARSGEIPLAEAAAHFDGCLGCLACVTACPSGVEYDKIIEGVRVDLEREVLRHWRDRLFRWFLFALFPYPARLRVAVLGGWDYQRVGLRALLTRLGLRQALPARLRAVEALMPPADLCSALSRIPAKTPAEGDARGHVGLVTGCVQRVFFHEVNAAAVRVLAAEGCEVLAPRTQPCCGALSLHAGRDDEAVARARAMIDTFDYVDVDTIVVNMAHCGSILKQYGDLLRDDPAYAQRAAAFAAKVKDVTELLAELEPRAPRGPVDATVAYHDACHLAHAQLRGISGTFDHESRATRHPGPKRAGSNAARRPTFDVLAAITPNTYSVCGSANASITTRASLMAIDATIATQDQLAGRGSNPRSDTTKRLTVYSPR
jgi:glycolate oxidase iron-sulfur subunit